MRSKVTILMTIYKVYVRFIIGWFSNGIQAEIYQKSAYSHSL